MAKDNGKTSKTARVMNLLSKKQDNAPATEESAAPAAPAAPAAGTAPVPPIISSLTNDAAVSNQIKDALEDALTSELDNTQPAAPEPEPAPVQAAPAPEPEPAPAPQPVQAPVAEQPAPAPVQPPVVEQPAPVVPQPVQVTPPPTEANPDHPGYINVMQVLVEEKSPKYVRMFGLCECQRCRDDVEALALNHLPPKYVVMSDHDRIPKITFYEGQYSSDVTAQLLQACKVVMERPHHKRDD